jgi:hypothetical protein
MIPGNLEQCAEVRSDNRLGCRLLDSDNRAGCRYEPEPSAPDEMMRAVREGMGEVSPC